MNTRMCAIIALIAAITWFVLSIITWFYAFVLAERGVGGELLMWADRGCLALEKLALGVALVMLGLGLLLGGKTARMTIDPGQQS